MNSKSLNCYEDQPRYTRNGYGIDISSQRLDDLDLQALDYLRNLQHQSEDGKVSLLELGCSSGGFSKTAASDFIKVIAIDACAYPKEWQAAITENNDLTFIQHPLPSFPMSLAEMSFDCVVSQRALHYLNYEDVFTVLNWCKTHLKREGRIYVSVSGVGSELGIGYSAINQPVRERWGRIDTHLAACHGIQHNVCLYSKTELTDIMELVGFRIVKSWVSDFGNIKAIGELYHE